MTSGVLGKLMDCGSGGGSAWAVKVLLEAQAHRPRPEDSAPDKLSEEP